MSATHPPKPPEMQLIEQRRDRTPVRRAAPLAGLSPTRWAQLEAGGREIRDTWVSETAPDRTLARMAWAVGVTAPELKGAGREAAAGILEEYAREHAARAEADAAEAERMVSAAERPMTARQRAVLAEKIAADLRDIRSEHD